MGTIPQHALGTARLIDWLARQTVVFRRPRRYLKALEAIFCQLAGI